MEISAICWLSVWMAWQRNNFTANTLTEIQLQLVPSNSNLVTSNSPNYLLQFSLVQFSLVSRKQWHLLWFCVTNTKDNTTLKRLAKKTRATLSSNQWIRSKTILTNPESLTHFPALCVSRYMYLLISQRDYFGSGFRTFS